LRPGGRWGVASLTPPPHGEWKGNAGQPIYFDGIDNSAYVTGKAPQSACTEMIYIEGLALRAVRWNQWKSVFTAKDAWLGPELNLASIPAIYNLQMDPGEQYDMTFNGAATPFVRHSVHIPGPFLWQR
ncbi:MAG TPA: hypothetical protein VNV86_01210, partial [Candidatus Acidoferrum sp.]|nr:hypothetical protein [Candidatus Acidoferrum sp.]